MNAIVEGASHFFGRPRRTRTLRIIRQGRRRRAGEAATETESGHGGIVTPSDKEVEWNDAILVDREKCRAVRGRGTAIDLP